MQSCTVHNKEYRQDITSQHLIAVATLFFSLLSFIPPGKGKRFAMVKCVSDETPRTHLSWAPHRTFLAWL